MKRTTIIFLLIITFFVDPYTLLGQEQNDSELSAEDIEKYKSQISYLVNYLQGTLNFLGDPNAVPKEKEVIINESYLKIFKNSKVQIEDDLDEDREVPLHKNVQAYLKDIEFFFRSVKFEFIIVDVNHFVMEDMHYFKVAFNRDLDGITITGDTVQSRKLRYMEVNLDLAKNDLQIASIYTTKLNEEEEIKNWWNDMSCTWKDILAKERQVNDSIRLSDVCFVGDSLIIICIPTDTISIDTTSNYDIDIPVERQSGMQSSMIRDTMLFDTKSIFAGLQEIVNLQRIDISGNQNVKDLSPLSELSELREVNISNTLATSIFPLRNLNKIEILNCSETPIEDLSPIQYTLSVKELDFSHTLINDPSPIGGLSYIEKLDCAGNRILDLSFVENLSNLKYLNCSYSQIRNLESLTDLKQLESIEISGTRVQDVEPLTGMVNLQFLNCENSSVVSLEHLKSIENLEVLNISHTMVNSLDAINGMSSMRKIYCDNTEIEKDKIIQFMRANPNCLVIFESEELQIGWTELEAPWKEIAQEMVDLSENPTKEELHSLLKIETLNLSGNTKITTLQPVRSLYSLKEVNLEGITVEDFSPLEDAIELEKLNLSNTSISDLYVLNSLNNLQELHIESTSISLLNPIDSLTKLNLIYADSSGIVDSEAFRYRLTNPGCVVIYKTSELENWWQYADEAWKEYFISSFDVGIKPSKEQLHEVLFSDSINIVDNSKINSLKALSIMQGLNSLIFSGTQVNDLSPIANLKNLKVLDCRQNPISSLTSLTGLIALERLDIGNTPVDDLKPISTLSNLKSLNCSGTQVKNISALSSLTKLERIELNNTSIKSLKPLLELSNLKHVSCFNTKISSKNIEKFKFAKPNTEIVFY